VSAVRFDASDVEPSRLFVSNTERSPPPSLIQLPSVSAKFAGLTLAWPSWGVLIDIRGQQALIWFKSSPEYRVEWRSEWCSELCPSEQGDAGTIAIGIQVVGDTVAVGVGRAFGSIGDSVGVAVGVPVVRRAVAVSVFCAFRAIIDAIIIGVGVAIPVVNDILAQSNVSGTTALILGLIPLMIGVMLLVSLASPLMGRMS